MKAVMLSVQPKWCELIASGQKTIEVRKTKPRLETPFKCYIYCTKGEPIYLPRDIFGNNAMNGKVIGEFICDRIRVDNEVADQLVDVGLMRHSCLSSEELLRYADGNALYSWHISDLKIYDEPKELVEFWKAGSCPFANGSRCTYEYHCFRAGQIDRCGESLTRPPQSWCYVEEV